MNARALLAELVATPSPSGEEQAVCALAATRAREAGLEVELLEGHTLLARLELGPGPRLLLASHLDTVPVGAGWSVDPHAAEWSDGRLVGRGANDAKASAAAMLVALAELAASASARGGARGTVWLALNAREETDNSGMGRVLERLAAFAVAGAGAGEPPLDGAVVGEPTGLEVIRAQAGLAVLVAEWSGRACHAAHVARVAHENALLRAAREIATLPDWIELDGRHPLVGASTIATTVFASGARHNVVPDRAEALFDARLAPNHQAADALRALQARLPAAALRVRSERLRPFETAERHPLVVAALAAAGKARALGSSTLSDMALLQGVPAVKCGPGETARSHVPDEFVLASELEAGCAFYTRAVPALLAALAQTPRTQAARDAQGASR